MNQYLILCLLVLRYVTFTIGFHCPGLHYNQNGRKITTNEGDTPTIRGLFSIIKADESDFDFDIGQGGVRLAMESVIKLFGSVKHAPGKAESSLKQLTRFKSLTPIKETTLQSTLNKLGATIICSGAGKEDYKNPGEGTEAIVVLAPMDAVRDALTGAGSAMNAETIVLNFAGGDDVQVLEVLEAAKQIVLMLDIATKAKVLFNSISTSEFPLGTSSLTVIGLPEGASTGGLEGVENAIATGEIYFCQGQYWTLLQENINTAIA